MKHELATPVRRIVRLLACTACATVMSNAQALVTYTYNGPELSTLANMGFIHPVDASGLVASFVLAEPLAPNLGAIGGPFASVTPLSWSVSGGGYGTFSDAPQTVLNNGSGLWVLTDASGLLVGWEFTVQAGLGSTDSLEIRSYLLPILGGGEPPSKRDQVTTSSPLGGPTGGPAINQGSNDSPTGGTWSVVATPVPEPDPAALLLAGTFVVGWMAQRRRRPGRYD